MVDEERDTKLVRVNETVYTELRREAEVTNREMKELIGEAVALRRRRRDGPEAAIPVLRDVSGQLEARGSPDVARLLGQLIAAIKMSTKAGKGAVDWEGGLTILDNRLGEALNQIRNGAIPEGDLPR